MSTFQWPQQVSLREVGLRDGLQSIARTLPTAQKIEWIREAYEAGLREIEVGSFVPPKLLPQLADTADLVAFAKTLPGLVVSVLVPNLKGAERAMDSGADWMLLPLSASHAHSLANLRKTPDEVVAEIGAMVQARQARGSNIRIEVGMSTSLGCTIQGEVAVDEVLRLLKAVLALGVDRVGLADTVGYADPRQVGELFAKAREVAGDKLACGHFHDTRGLGIANVMAALQTGETRFDACLAGIGGCPHAPGASGNVATEDLAYLFASMGIATGIDFDKLMALRAKVAAWLAGECLHGSIAQAGLPKPLRAQLTPEKALAFPTSKPSRSKACASSNSRTWSWVQPAAWCWPTWGPKSSRSSLWQAIARATCWALGRAFFRCSTATSRASRSTCKAPRGPRWRATCAPPPMWWPRTSSPAPWPSTAWTTPACRPATPS